MFAFEIKKNAVIREEDLKGLHAFKKDYPVARCFLLYGGSRAERREHIQIIPYEEALVRLPEIMGAGPVKPS